MTRERLQSLPLEELRRFAERQSIELDDAVDKESLVDLLLEVFEEVAEEREELASQEVRVEAKKYTNGVEDPLGAQQEDYPPIPQGYNETRLVVMPRDPTWAFAYWEIGQDKAVQLRRDKDVRLMLRVHDVTGVRFNGRNSRSSFEIPVKLTDSRWYINLPRAASEYILELLYKKKGKEHLLIRSNVFQTPPEDFSERIDPEWPPLAGDLLLQMSLHRASSAIPGSGSIPQRILSVTEG